MSFGLSAPFRERLAHMSAVQLASLQSASRSRKMNRTLVAVAVTCAILGVASAALGLQFSAVFGVVSVLSLAGAWWGASSPWVGATDEDVEIVRQTLERGGVPALVRLVHKVEKKTWSSSHL